MHRRSLVVLAACGAVFAAACGDSPTAIDRSPPPSLAASLEPSAPGAEMGGGLTCQASTRTQGALGGPWRHAIRTVRFAREELAPDGATLTYRFLGHGASGLVSWVICEVPATEKAIRRLDRGFGVSRAISRAQLPSASRAPGARTSPGPRYDTVCNATGCQLDGMTVYACYYGGTYPNCNPNPNSLANMQCGALDPYCNGFGGSYYEGGGWTTTGSGNSPQGDPVAFPQGPLLWAGCVLAMAGSTLAVADVMGAFKGWHSAYLNAVGAYNLWQATIQNGASPEIQQLYEYQWRQARQRQEDAKQGVSSATNISYLALGGFAVACGAAILAPTP